MIQNLQIGATASISKKITEEDLATFANLSMDTNPIHLNEEFAKNSPFGRPIAHGLYVASFISAVIANHLPGPGSIYLKQEIAFKKPVFLGDTVTAMVTITEFPKPSLIRLSTTCTNQNSEIVIEEIALIKRPTT